MTYLLEKSQFNGKNGFLCSFTLFQEVGVYTSAYKKTYKIYPLRHPLF